MKILMMAWQEISVVAEPLFELGMRSSWQQKMASQIKFISKNHKISDSIWRIHDYLRISLTDNCNFRCFYCMPDDDYDFTHASRLMQPDEILALVKVFVDQKKYGSLGRAAGSERCRIEQHWESFLSSLSS